MRRVLFGARRLGFAAISVTLAAGLISVPATQASASGRVASQRSGQSGASPDSLLRLARSAGLRSAPLTGLTGLTGESLLRAGTGKAGTGAITGRVSSRPRTGICVTASGQGTTRTAAVGSDGSYLLAGLRPGRYAVRAARCQGAARPAGQPFSSVTIPAAQTGITVRAGMITTAGPTVMWLTGSQAATWIKPLTTSAGAKKGSISGVVTGGKKPLAGVCAVAFPTNFQNTKIALTAKNGTYRITGLKPGKYQVNFIAGFKRCPNAGNWLSQWYPQVNSDFPTGKVKIIGVTAGKDVKGINARLARGGEIAGVVRDKSGKPLAGVCADVQGQFFDGDSSPPPPTETVGVASNLSTDKSGHYVVHGLFPGSYQVEFNIGCGTKGNYAFQWWRNVASEHKATTIILKGAEDFEAINATLLPGAGVSGTVRAVNASGKTLSNICVTAVAKSDANPYAFANTNRKGHYSVIGLAAGEYILQFDPSCGNDHYLYQQRLLTLKTGEDEADYNVFLRKAGGITGTVTDASGHPLGGVCVLVNNEDGYDDSGNLAKTNPNGGYQLLGVQPGTFKVEFSGGCGNSGSLAPQFYPDQPYSPSATRITFKGTKVTPGIDAKMQPGGTIAGTVTGSKGNPVAGACVEVVNPELYFPDNEDGVSGATVVRGGRYELANLPASAFDVVFGCGHFGFQWYKAQQGPETATSVSTVSGTTTRVNARLSLAGAISGTVTSSAGKPLRNVCVAVSPANSTVILGASGLSITSKSGFYRTGGLPAGSYLVQFGGCSFGFSASHYASQWYKNQTSVHSATVIHVHSAGTVKGIDAALTQGGEITGTVTDPAGKPLRDVCIEADSSADVDGADAITSATGHYRLAGLASGNYSLTFAPCNPNAANLARLTRPGLVHVTAPRMTSVPGVRLAAGGWIAGQVVDGTDGNAPVRGTCVAVEGVGHSGILASGFTGSTGDYLVTNLAAGKYRVYFAPPLCEDDPDLSPPFAPQWYKGQPTPGPSTIVTVSAGKRTDGIGATLQGFGSVGGTVTTTAKAPVSGECVTAVPLKGEVQVFTGFAVQPERSATDHAGSYSIAGLEPGRYQIEFSSGCGDSGFATQWWNNQGSAKSAKVITVRYAAITGVNAEVHH